MKKDKMIAILGRSRSSFLVSRASRLPLLSSLIISEVSALIVNNQVFELLTAKIQSANKA